MLKILQQIKKQCQPPQQNKPKTNEKNNNSNQSKKLNFALIQNYKLLVVFLSLASKIATVPRLKHCCSEQAIEKKICHLFNLKKVYFFAFAILRCCKSSKTAFTYADRAFKIKQFYKHACWNWHRCSQRLKNFRNKMRLKIDEKINTAGRNWKFTGSIRKGYFDFFHFWKPLKPNVTVKI